MRKLCECHGEPCYWQNDRRDKKGGHWRCSVRKRAAERARYERVAAVKLERQRAYYFDHGWKVKRLNDLGQARKRVVTEMEALSARAIT